MSISLTFTDAPTSTSIGFSTNSAVNPALADCFSEVTFTGSLEPSLTAIYKSDGITPLKVVASGAGGAYDVAVSTLYSVRVV